MSAATLPPRSLAAAVWWTHGAQQGVVQPPYAVKFRGRWWRTKPAASNHGDSLTAEERGIVQALPKIPYGVRKVLDYLERTRRRFSDLPLLDVAEIARCHKPPPSGGQGEPRLPDDPFCPCCGYMVLTEAVVLYGRRAHPWCAQHYVQTEARAELASSVAAVGDIEERRAEYEWDGAPRGVCVVCGMFYEENVSHAGKDAPDSRPKHRFKTAPSGAAVDDGATPRPWTDGDYAVTGPAAAMLLTAKWALEDSGRVPGRDCIEVAQQHGDRAVALVAGNTPEEARANAALIVAAVNSHDALLAACKGIASQPRWPYRSNYRNYWRCEFCGQDEGLPHIEPCAGDALLKAIALAEGGA
jgi:hypothetical protein